MITKKHYIDLANIITDTYFLNAQEKERFLERLCEMFKRDNPHFDKVRFKEAAYD